jgi:hypothetical protein
MSRGNGCAIFATILSHWQLGGGGVVQEKDSMKRAFIGQAFFIAIGWNYST